MRPIDLTPRLKSIANLVSRNCRLADIGTDHAKLPIYLLQQGTIPYAIISDIRQGPLDCAMRNIQRYGLTELVSIRLCNGLERIHPDEVEVITIAGMGGETISAILQDATWTKSRSYQLLLQPMSALPELRLWLTQNGYSILSEHLCQEGNTLYTVLSVLPGASSPYHSAELWAGRQTQDQDYLLRKKLLLSLAERTEKALLGLSKSTRAADIIRREQLDEVLKGLKLMYEEWEACQL